MTELIDPTTEPANLILDENFIPVDAGVIFHATFPNPLDYKHRTLVTLADGRLLEITEGRNRIISRTSFVKSGSSTTYHLDALRAKITRVFPTRDEVRRLPRSEQYALLDQIEEHLEAAEEMISPGGEILRERRKTDDGQSQWLLREIYVHTFNLWDTGYMPRWTTGSEPAWGHTASTDSNTSA